MKGSWIIELNKNDVLQVVVPLYPSASDVIGIPWASALFARRSFRFFKSG
jgi:hypothetical protein